MLNMPQFPSAHVQARIDEALQSVVNKPICENSYGALQLEVLHLLGFLRGVERGEQRQSTLVCAPCVGTLLLLHSVVPGNRLIPVHRLSQVSNALERVQCFLSFRDSMDDVWDYWTHTFLCPGHRL